MGKVARFLFAALRPYWERKERNRDWPLSCGKDMAGNCRWFRVAIQGSAVHCFNHVAYPRRAIHLNTAWTPHHQHSYYHHRLKKKMK